MPFKKRALKYEGINTIDICLIYAQAEEDTNLAPAMGDGTFQFNPQGHGDGGGDPTISAAAAGAGAAFNF